MTNGRLILLTNTWPFDNGETFLCDEAPFLSAMYECVEVFPLYAVSDKKREMPENFNLHTPALYKDLKSRGALLFQGVFSTAPLLFAVADFFREKAWRKGKIWNFFTALLTFRASYPTLRRFKITVDDTLYSYWGDKWALSLPFIKEMHRCKTMARFHGSDLYESAKGGYIPFRRRLIASVDKIFTISENGAKYIKQNYADFLSGDVKIARLGVKSFGLNPDATDYKGLSIVSCSNAIPLKRLEMIAEALMKVDFQVKWTHIGSGPTLKNIEEMAKSMNSNVEICLKGQMSNSEVRKLYTREHFDLFINVSTTEGVPVSIMEALSAGIAVIATNVGGTGEIVDSEVGELLNAEINAEELKKVLSKYYLNIKNLKSLRENAVLRWNKMCNSDKNYRYFISQIND